MTDQRYLFVTLHGVPAPELLVPIQWMNGYGPMRIKRHDRDVTVTKDGVTFKAWRDDLRNGWHVVPEGVRYVAVQGVKAGQPSYSFSDEQTAKREAANWNATTLEMPRFASKARDADRWCVLDLHDLKDHRQPTGANRPADNVTIVMGDSFADTSPRYAARQDRQQEHTWSKAEDDQHRCSCKAASCATAWLHGSEVAGTDYPEDWVNRCNRALNAYAQAFRGPRFQVKPAASMREGEPSTSYWKPMGWEEGPSLARVHDICAALNRGEPRSHHVDKWVTKRGEHVPLWGLIDTHSPDWQAFDAKHRKGENSDQADAITYAHEALRKAYTEAGPPHRWRHDADYYRCSCGVMSRNQPRGLPSTACEIAWRLYAESNMLESDVLPEIAKPKAQGPTDAEIVEAWATYQRKEWGDFSKALGAPRIKVGEYSVTLEQCRAAWSRELQKRAAASREKDRQRVVCEGTLESDY